MSPNKYYEAVRWVKGKRVKFQCAGNIYEKTEGIAIGSLIALLKQQNLLNAASCFYFTSNYQSIDDVPFISYCR